MEAAAQDVVYTVPEIARMLKVSRTTVYRMIEEGVLETFKARSDLRILARSVRKLLGE